MELYAGLYIALYVTINATTIILLSFVYFKTKNRVGMSEDVIALQTATTACMALPVVDTIWMLGENSFIVFPRWLNITCNMFYMIMTCVVSFSWLVYSEKRLRLGKSNKFIKICSIPLFVFIILCVTSIWTKWIFYVDENNVYHRGSLYIVQLIFAYSFLAIAVVRDLMYAARVKSSAQRHDALVLANFAILPAIASLIQGFIYGLPLSWIATALSFVLVFINLQEAQISTDALTGLYNRRAMDTQLHTKTANVPKGKVLYFIMLDIDDFKQINDKYGHLEGDGAIILVANVLKQLSNEYNAFATRSGGDEFCVIAELDAELAPEILIDEIHQRLKQTAEKKGVQYNITVCIGYERYRENMTIEELMNSADKMLYEHKAFFKSSKRTKNGTDEFIR